MSVIGIDLGTANSRVAVVRQTGTIKVLQDKHGRKIPSYVAFTPEKRFIGRVAKYQMGKNPKNTIYGFKRLIGKSHDEVAEMKRMEGLPFDLEDSEGKPKIRVQYRGRTKQLYPEEISAMVLSRLKDIVLENIALLKDTASKKVEAVALKKVEAVITVPASFNIAQRKATCDAANIAGINVLGLINETTAVALGYRQRVQMEFVARTALVLHVGVGTFDVSVISIAEHTLTVRATIGNSNLGGENFTLRLFDKFCRIHQVDVKSNPADACKMRIACEELKSGLSDANQSSVKVETSKGLIELTITRDEFCKQTSDYLEQIYGTIQQAMNVAGIINQQIDDVLVTGGSAGLPIITEMMKKIKIEDKIRAVDMDEDAAYGAAALAAVISQKDKFHWKDFAIQDVLSQSFSISCMAKPIFQWGSSIPQTKFCQNSMAESYEAKLVNNERFVEANGLEERQHAVGRINIFPALNESTAECQFVIDGYGLPTASPTAQMDLRIGLSKGEIEQSLREAEVYRADDEMRKQVEKEHYRLESETDKTHALITSYLSKCEEILQWCRKVPDPSFKELQEKLTQLSDIQHNMRLTKESDSRPRTEDTNGTPAKQTRRESDATTLPHYQESNPQLGVIHRMRTKVATVLPAFGFGYAEPDSDPTGLQAKFSQLREGNAKLEDDTKLLQAKFSELRARNSQLKDDMKILQDQDGNLRCNVAESEQRIKELEKVKEDLKEDNVSLQRNVEEKSQKIKAQKKAIKDRKDQDSSLRCNIAESEKRIKELENVEGDLKAKSSQLQAENAKLKEDMKILQADNDSLRLNLDETVKKKETQKKAQRGWKSEKNDLQRSVKELQQKIKGVEEAEADSETKFSRLQARNAKLEDHVKVLQADNESLRHNLDEAEKKKETQKKAQRGWKKEKSKPSKELKTSKARKEEKEDTPRLKKTQESKVKTGIQKSKEKKTLQKEDEEIRQLKDEINRLRKENDALKPVRTEENKQSHMTPDSEWADVSRSRIPAQGGCMKDGYAALRYQEPPSMSRFCDHYIESHGIQKPPHGETHGIHTMSTKKLAITMNVPPNATTYILRVTPKSCSDAGFKTSIRIGTTIQHDTDYEYFLCFENKFGQNLDSRLYDANASRSLSSAKLKKAHGSKVKIPWK